MSDLEKFVLTKITNITQLQKAFQIAKEKGTPIQDKQVLKNEFNELSKTLTGLNLTALFIANIRGERRIPGVILTLLKRGKPIINPDAIPDISNSGLI